MPESDAEKTQVHSAVTPLAQQQTTEFISPFAEGATTVLSPPQPPAGDKLRAGIGRSMMITGGVLALLVITYLVDVLVNWGDVPRGVAVAGVDVGGLSRTAAEDKLRETLQPRFDRPVTVKAGDVETKFNPESAGLGIDWQGTLDQAGNAPLNPISRITSFWAEREIGIVSQSIPERLRSMVSQLADAKLNHPKIEGDIRFKQTAGGTEAVAVMPHKGQRLTSIDDAIAAIESEWLNQGGVTLDVETSPAKTTPEGVRATLRQVAEPAVSGPIVMRGDGANGFIQPKVIGKAFEFTPADDGSLKATVTKKTLRAALEPQLAGTEQEGRDAQIVFESGAPTVSPAAVGRQIDWQSTLEPYLDVIKRSENRSMRVVYMDKQPTTTTQEARNLGIKEVIGEFTTYGFEPDSGVNIRRVAEEVDGAIVKPGETFSLNGYTGKRTKEEGYIEAGVIENGIPSTEVGGGISQFATTLYNASYFAGLEDAGHQEHSYYISRYPMGREATVYQYPNGESVIDVAFTNNAPTGVAIQTEWTPSSITVTIWGTKRYRIESITSPKRNIVQAGKIKNDDPECEPSSPLDGFTVTDTRVLYDIHTGEVVSRESQTTVYDPLPQVICTHGRKE
ncbi:MAG: vanomycin resistance protein VanB [Actinophytocola sp.]|nr:vanomycin resistance protein VanB [Actinophytocola sp.]